MARCAADERSGRIATGGFPRLLWLLALCLIGLAGCTGDPEPAYKPEFSVNPPPAAGRYVLAPHPLMNPQKLAEVYGAIVEQLNRRLAPERIQLALEASSSYRAFNDKLKNRRVDFALSNPYQTLLAQDVGYVIFGKMDNDEDFRGIFLVRRNAGFKSPADLKGKSISFPAPTALAATMMPELFLKEHGVDPGRDINPLFVGTHDSAILNVCLDISAAGCTSPRAWRLFQRERPGQAAKLELRWQTERLPNNGLVARADLPQHVRSKVAEAFFALQESEAGRSLLERAGVSRFVPADSATYEPVRSFVRRYSERVRELGGLDE